MAIPKSLARKNFAHVLADAKRGKRVKITHYGRTSAYVVSREDVRKLEACERRERNGRARRKTGVKSTGEAGEEP